MYFIYKKKIERKHEKGAVIIFLEKYFGKKFTLKIFKLIRWCFEAVQSWRRWNLVM